MRLIIVCLLLIFKVTSSFGSRCIYKGHKLELGEEYAPPGLCCKLSCFGRGHIRVQICPKLAVLPKCTNIPRDDSKPYPECCERYVC